MRTRLLGLLASTSLILTSAAYAEPAPVASALFRPVAMGIDAVLLAANLADVDPAVVPDTDQCEYDALNGQPEPAAALSLEPAETASVALDAEHQQKASVRDGDRDPNAHDGAASALSTDDSLGEAAEAVGSTTAPVHVVGDISPTDAGRSVAVETVSASGDRGTVATDQQPEPAAVLSPETRDTVGGTPVIEPQHEASVLEGERGSDTDQAPGSALSQAEPIEATGSLSGPAMPGSEVGPDFGPDEVVSPEGEKAEVREAHADPLPTPEVTESLNAAGPNPPATGDSNQDSDIILP
jgi:hypothetical protein